MRTPKFCIACGGRLTTATLDGRRRRRCAGCGWTFYDNPVPAAVALVVRGERILLARRAHPPYEGTWDLPGGFLEAGELPERGLQREIREELGVRMRRARLIGFATDRYGRTGFPVLTLIYRAALEPGPIRPADDVAGTRWFPADGVPWRRIAFPAMRRVLRAYLSGRRRPGPAGSSRA